VVARAITAGLKITRKQTKPIAAPSSDYGSDFDEETVNELLLRTGAVLDIDSKRDTISRLPDELIVWIASQLKSYSKVNALARTNESITRLLLEAGSVDLCSQDKRALLGLAEYESGKSTLELLQKYGIYTH
jgi:hypothetical protein